MDLRLIWEELVTNANPEILMMVFFGLLFCAVIVHWCGYSHEDPGEILPPPVRQLYRQPPVRVQDGGGRRPESTTAMMAIYYNYHLTEVIVTNPHVFILFCLSREFCPFSGAFMTLIGEAAEEIKHASVDSVPRVIAAANCSIDPVMASKHNVHQYPTLSYFRNGIYFCDYTGDRNVQTLKRFVITVVTHQFGPQ